MMGYDPIESISNTRQGFEESFEAGPLYDRQTQDQAHLESILNCLNIKDNMKILDLGTGTGYLAFPIADSIFDLVITRYALHHFPAIHDTFQEIHRVLKPDGFLFLSDPAPNDEDTDGFIDAYMQMKKDGHIKFYTKTEWQTIGRSAGFKLTHGFETQIRFPRQKQTAIEFEDLIAKFDKQIIKGYAIKITDEEIWITERVNNLLFQKSET